MVIMLTGLVWGYSEATLFFLVPDIWLTWTILHHPEKVIPTYLLTLTGALIGGALMYHWGSSNQALIRQVLDWIPAISPELIGETGEALRNEGFAGMLKGSFTGRPYKLYASQAGHSGIPLSTFMLMSIPARLARWIALGTITIGVKRLLISKGMGSKLTLVWGLAWLTNYLIYFLVMDN